LDSGEKGTEIGIVSVNCTKLLKGRGRKSSEEYCDEKIGKEGKERSALVM